MGEKLNGIEKIDATLWQLTKQDPKVFAADSTLCQVVRHGASTRSTRQLSMGEKLNGIEKILIPVNIDGNHWTLLVTTGCSSLSF